MKPNCDVTDLIKAFDVNNATKHIDDPTYQQSSNKPHQVMTNDN